MSTFLCSSIYSLASVMAIPSLQGTVGAEIRERSTAISATDSAYVKRNCYISGFSFADIWAYEPKKTDCLLRCLYGN
jgi:hypothetical protein